MRIFLIAALTLGGCAAPAQPATTQGTTPASPNHVGGQAGDEVECQNEAPTGSRIQHSTCRDKFERDGEKRNAADWMQRSRSQPAPGN